MIKKVSLHAKGTQVVPTGYKPIRRAVAPAPRDSTRPVTGSPHMEVFADAGGASGGAYRLPPKARPHILQGWKK